MSIPKAKGHRVMENSSSPLVLSCLAPGKGSTHGSASVSRPWVFITLSLMAGHWAGTNVCLFCRHKDSVGPSSQPLWPAEGRVIRALVSSLGLCSLKSLMELEGIWLHQHPWCSCNSEQFRCKAFEDYHDGPELCFASPAELCAPLPAGCCVNGTLLAFVSTLSCQQSRWLCL